jgi:molybdopterin molybdotransferase
MNEKIASEPSCADPFEPGMISLAEALAQIEARVRPVIACERLPIRDCLNRVNNEAVKSPRDVPPAANSAMDGYAIAIDSLAEAGITEFDMIGSAFAGKPFDGTCAAGECVRIMTGALLPAGTDTVVMQEQTEIGKDGKIRIDAEHRAGENIRRAGEDIKQGEIVIEAGVRLNPADLGVLASLGIAKLQVRRKPIVAFFSTGDELMSVGEKLKPGMIYDSNRYSLHGMLARLPVDTLDLGVVRDNPDSMRAALEDAASRADLIISTGGVSVGEADYIKPALADLGTTEFWKIAIKPGRPLTFGQIGSSIFMGLPGNPVAVMVTFSQFVEPAIEVLSGTNMRPPRLLPARALDSLRKKPGRTEFQRGIATLDADGRWQVSKTGKQGSGILTSMSRANCLIVLPDDNAGVEPGDEVSIQFLDWAR